MGLLKREPTLAEIEEENEILEAKNKQASLDYSITEKKAMAKKLRDEYGLTPAHFSFDFEKIMQWLRTH